MKDGAEPALARVAVANANAKTINATFFKLTHLQFVLLISSNRIIYPLVNFHYYNSAVMLIAFHR